MMYYNFPFHYCAFDLHILCQTFLLHSQRLLSFWAFFIIPLVFINACFIYVAADYLSNLFFFFLILSVFFHFSMPHLRFWLMAAYLLAFSIMKGIQRNGLFIIPLITLVQVPLKSQSIPWDYYQTKLSQSNVKRCCCKWPNAQKQRYDCKREICNYHISRFLGILRAFQLMLYFFSTDMQ